MSWLRKLTGTADGEPDSDLKQIVFQNEGEQRSVGRGVKRSVRFNFGVCPSANVRKALSSLVIRPGLQAKGPVLKEKKS